ncbi:hypothetical protein Hanom_Chr06g00528181 [Helianthus anomalus]
MDYPAILSTSNSTPSLIKTNISLTNATGIPLGYRLGLSAITIEISRTDYSNDFWRNFPSVIERLQLGFECFWCDISCHHWIYSRLCHSRRYQRERERCSHGFTKLTFKHLQLYKTRP